MLPLLPWPLDGLLCRRSILLNPKELMIVFLPPLSNVRPHFLTRPCLQFLPPLLHRPLSLLPGNYSNLRGRSNNNVEFRVSSCPYCEPNIILILSQLQSSTPLSHDSYNTAVIIPVIHAYICICPSNSLFLLSSIPIPGYGTSTTTTTVDTPPTLATPSGPKG